MVDEHYQNQQLAEVYDFDSPWSIDREFYLSMAGHPPQRILDLGCGTGLLCDAYAAKGHSVTGVDPSAAMLAVARRKPYGNVVQWVQSSAQSYRSDELFDLIIMTGHAFQVLLDDADIMAAFSTMRKHLAPTGTVVFESRNPLIDWANKWNYEMVVELPDHVVRESRHFLSMQGERMTFDLHYAFPDRTLVSSSELRFLSRAGIQDRLAQCGLRVDQLFGDWQREPFDERASEEMIFVVQPAGDSTHEK